MSDNFGFIHDRLDIKILILYILRRLRDPAQFGTLTELTMCDGGVSYFDFSECLAELVKTGHVSLEDGGYVITEKGERNGSVTEVNLPYSVRCKADESTTALRAAIVRDALIETSHSRIPDSESGWETSLSIADGVGEIISMKIFAASEKHAIALEKGFRKNAEKAYAALLEILIG